MLTDMISVLMPLLLMAGGGILMARLFRLSEETLVTVVADFFMPLLIFHALYGSEVEITSLGRVAAASALVFLGLLVVAITAARMFRIRVAGLALPVLFMNSGFLGIPLMQLWGGLPAMNLIVIFDQVNTIFLFTVGIALAAGGVSGRSIRGFLTSPMLWAIVLAFIVRWLRIELPVPLMDSLAFGARAASPVAAFALGASLSRNPLHIRFDVLLGVLLRFGAGFAVALLVVTVLGIHGIERTVVLVASSLPAAVMSYVLPSRYGTDPDTPRSVVVFSTILSIVWVPIVFSLAGAV